MAVPNLSFAETAHRCAALRLDVPTMGVSVVAIVPVISERRSTRYQ
jgi:hypothetical protein